MNGIDQIRLTAWPVPKSNAPSTSLPTTSSLVGIGYQIPWGNLVVIDDPSAVSARNDLVDAAEVLTAILAPENTEPVSWELVKRDLKL
jgi:hypothetical protein